MKEQNSAKTSSKEEETSSMNVHKSSSTSSIQQASRQEIPIHDVTSTRQQLEDLQVELDKQKRRLKRFQAHGTQIEALDIGMKAQKSAIVELHHGLTAQKTAIEDITIGANAHDDLLK